MNDNAIKNYAAWARRELMAEVEKRCAWWGISEGAQTNVDSVDGRVLSAQERKQRADLLRIVRADGYDQLVEKAAYTWFNRLLAIRFMEVNDRLPSHVRMLSSANGEFEPQCLREALDLPLKTLDKDEAIKLVQTGDDEGLFKLVFLAQCAELSECMPAVFEPVGSAMELLLPTGLLRKDGVVGKLVSDIPEDDWREGVEIVGWMYQYYVSERKDEVFASFKKGKKAERDAIAPATQLFTPHWIVRYLTENSLGRLWMLNHPDSKLAERMPYFIKPDDEHEMEFRRLSSPEEVTCVDPACGSGHILVYAFELLAAMYEEAGYSNRDAARLIVEKNLTGLEIDPRAAAMASFALTMKACELDSRFLRRGVVPRVTVLERIEFEPDELALCPSIAERTALLDAVAHLDECGSLLQPTQEDVVAIERDLASLSMGDSLFADSAAAKLERLLAELRPLAARYDVVVANPPYMGGKNMNRWLGSWVKNVYPNVKGDLFSCFIARNSELGADHAQLGFMTPYVWMFIGTYEKLRRFVIEKNTITSLVQLEYSGFAGATVPICTFTLQKGHLPNYKGGYIRLSDFVGADNQSPRVLEALADPECGWFFRRSEQTFKIIPGSPIAYWASAGFERIFSTCQPFDRSLQFREGIHTANNERFLRLWWEISSSLMVKNAKSLSDIDRDGRWVPYCKGGQFRKWYGNFDYLIGFDEKMRDEMRQQPGCVWPSQSLWFKEGGTWTAISSGCLGVRYYPVGCLFDAGGQVLVGGNCVEAIAALNSSLYGAIASFTMPTLNYKCGVIKTLPDIRCGEMKPVKVASSNVCIARDDWDTAETSWDFKRHPLC